MIGGSVIVERALRRDRVLVVSCLLFVVALSWAYLLSGAGMMQEMGRGMNTITIDDLKRDPLVSESALRGGGDDEDETSAVENELTSSETPETVLAAKEIAAAVNAAMEALPEELRQAVTLREIEGLSYEEIAEVMNCPIGTVRSRIFRAREAISAKVRPMLENQSGKRW